MSAAPVVGLRVKFPVYRRFPQGVIHADKNNSGIFYLLIIVLIDKTHIKLIVSFKLAVSELIKEGR
jgi:hypothetical protein